MLLPTILIKNDAVFSLGDALVHLADGLRYSSQARMCLPQWMEFKSGFKASGKPDVAKRLLTTLHRWQ
jgi:hypothetical protein